MPGCRYELNGAGRSLERLSMIAGGTGITPMYQVRPVPCKAWELRRGALVCSGRTANECYCPLSLRASRVASKIVVCQALYAECARS